MSTSDLAEKAKKYAEEKHFGQVRKYTGEPYIVHPYEVARLVEAVDGTPEMVAAAYLHDVVEDCGISIDEIGELFGKTVEKYVWYLTDISKPEDGNRELRKSLDRFHISQAPPEAKTIKLADLLSNTRTIVWFDPDFARVYLREKELLLPHLEDGNHILLNAVKGSLLNSILFLKETNQWKK